MRVIFIFLVIYFFSSFQSLSAQIHVLNDGSTKLDVVVPLVDYQWILVAEKNGTGFIVRRVSKDDIGGGSSVIEINDLLDGKSDKKTFVFLGEKSGFNNGGEYNTGVGISALENNTRGIRNSALGYSALSKNTTGLANSAFGMAALSKNTTGSRNSGFGDTALYHNTKGESNTATGMHAMHWNSIGSYNSAYGVDALFYNGQDSVRSSGDGNSAFGYRSLHLNVLGSYNSALGYEALFVAKGNRNIGIGYRAGYSLTSGSSNIYIGNNVTVLNTSFNNQINIGNAIYKIGNDPTDPSVKHLGVFNSNPLFALDVTGDGHFSGAFHASQGSSGNPNDILTSTGTGTKWTPIQDFCASCSDNGHTGTPGSVFFADTDGTPTENNSHLFWDKQEERLGIGTKKPVVKLHVIGQVRASSFRSGNGTKGLPAFRFEKDSNTGMYRAGSDRLAFSTGGQERVRIDNDGNVGIGTSTPKEKLEVKGNIKGEMAHLGGNHYNVLSYHYNGTPSHGIKIKTNIPFQNSVEMPTIKIEGFNYHNGQTIGLMLNWYVYGGNFIKNSISSHGNYTPKVMLSNESGKVVIYIDDKKYFNRFTVQAYAQGMAEKDSWFEGWTAVDETLTGSNTVQLLYGNSVGTLTVKNAIKDGTGFKGEPGQVLSSTSNGVKWINNQIVRFGAQTTGGVQDWNDVTNARAGSGKTLLHGNDLNGPGSDAAGNYFHPFSLEYGSQDGNGNMTQFAIPYHVAGLNKGIYLRTRYSGNWSNWSRMISEDNSGNVGIGTTSPTEKLDVDGNLHLSGKGVSASTVDSDPGNTLVTKDYIDNSGYSLTSKYVIPIITTIGTEEYNLIEYDSADVWIVQNVVPLTDGGLILPSNLPINTVKIIKNIGSDVIKIRAYPNESLEKDYVSVSPFSSITLHMQFSKSSTIWRVISKYDFEKPMVKYTRKFANTPSSNFLYSLDYEAHANGTSAFNISYNKVRIPESGYYKLKLLEKLDNIGAKVRLEVFNGSSVEIIYFDPTTVENQAIDFFKLLPLTQHMEIKITAVDGKFIGTDSASLFLIEKIGNL